MAEIVVVGALRLHHAGRTGASLSPGRVHALAEWTQQAGGSGAAIACAAARLGRSVRFVGVAGDDDAGRFLQEALTEGGVDARSVRLVPGGVTASLFAAVEPSGRRTAFASPGELPPLAIEELPAELLDGAKLVIVDGQEPAAQEVLARRARGRGLPVVLDAAPGAPDARALLACVDQVIASERFSAELGGTVSAALAALLELGPSVAVVPLGDEGAVGLSRAGESAQAPAFEVALVDSTGARSVFVAAFADALLDGLPLRRRLERANAAASLACASLGPTAGLPTREELEARLRRG